MGDVRYCRNCRWNLVGCRDDDVMLFFERAGFGEDVFSFLDVVDVVVLCDFSKMRHLSFWFQKLWCLYGCFWRWRKR